MAKPAGLGVHDSDLRAYRDHARVLDEKGGRTCVWIYRIDKTAAKSTGI
jgi:hypothetical protein